MDDALVSHLKLLKEENNSHYFTAEFYITSDAVNKVLSYIPILEVTKGKMLKKEIQERIKNIKSLK